MNSYDILFSMEYIDKDLAEKAADYRRNNLTHLRTVAAACLILIFGVTAVFAGISAKSFRQDNTAGPLNNTEIPAGIETDNYQDSNVITDPNMPAEEYKPYGWQRKNLTDYLTEEYYTVVYGNAKNAETHTTEVLGHKWHITTFDIEIIESVRNAPESGKIKVCAVTYDDLVWEPGRWAPDYLKVSKGFDIINRPTSLFILNNNKTPEQTGWMMLDYTTVGETDIKTFDCADYYVRIQCREHRNIFEIDERYFKLDEIEKFIESGVPEEEKFNKLSDENRRRFEGYELLPPVYVPKYDEADTIMKEFETGDTEIKVVLRDGPSDFDYSGIRVRIYSAVKLSQSPGLSYDNIYSFTVNVDKDGVAVFDKPTASFLAEIDLYSLPEGIVPFTGSRFVEAGMKTGNLVLRYEDDLYKVPLEWRKVD